MIRIAKVLPLVPRAKGNAEERLATYIDYARNECVEFGINLWFDADVWHLTDFYSRTKHGDAKSGNKDIYFLQRLADGGEPFCSALAGFARAYIRTELSDRHSSSWGRATAAFRALDTAIQECNVESLCDCNALVFDRAAELLKCRSETDISTGYTLAKIAHFLDEGGMVHAPLHDWRYPCSRSNTFSRVGPEFESRRHQKLPSDEALEALGQAFNEAIERRDVLVASVAALMCSAPVRFNEVLRLPLNCEVKQAGDDGKILLGLRWAGSKGAVDHVKWMLPAMIDVDREALARIKRITQPAREMAKWYEENPGKIYLLPSAFAGVSSKKACVDVGGSWANS